MDLHSPKSPFGERPAAELPIKVCVTSDLRAKFLQKSVWRAEIPAKLRLTRIFPAKVHLASLAKRENTGISLAKRDLLGIAPRQIHFRGMWPIGTRTPQDAAHLCRTGCKRNEPKHALCASVGSITRKNVRFSRARKGTPPGAGHGSSFDLRVGHSY